MVFSEKMLEKTGTPSTGQPIPVSGWQKGDDQRRMPTRVIPLGAKADTGVPLGPPLRTKGRPPGPP
jgi:hypothetical protein